MTTDIVIVSKIDRDDFSDEAFQIESVKNEPRVYDIFTECGSSSSEHKHVSDSYQEQNQENLDRKNLTSEDLDHSKFSDNLSNKCEAVLIKNEDDIDILYEDIKRETGEKKSSQGFCKVCYQNLNSETDIFKSTSYTMECSCQKQYDFYDFQDMSYDVKGTLDLTPASGLKSLEVHDETSGHEVAKEQDSPAVPRRLSVQDNMKKHIFCSNPLENNLLKQQMEDMTEKIIHCKLCLETSSQTGYLKVHEKIHTDKKPYHCNICSNTFNTSNDLKVHGRIHTDEKPYHCKLCSKSFSRMSNLKFHEKSHTGEKQYHCKICSRAFKTSDKLKIHERIHTGEKPFHCKLCSKSFSQTGNLKVHERSHNGEKPFNCEVCLKSFTSKWYLSSHEKLHTGEKQYHCKICSKTFNASSNLKVHGRIHTGEKPFHCKFCSKSFRKTSNLKVHERSHTGEKPFNCEVCLKSFTSKWYLSIHERLHTVKNNIIAKFVPRLSTPRVI